MKGDKAVLDHLQQALSMELTAVRQYLFHSHLLADWGLDKLALKMKDEMHEELGHADRLLARIMFLEGEPELAGNGSVARPQSVKDMFEADLRDEYEARTYYTTAADTAYKAGDLGSRELFIDLIRDEEGHIDWIESQINLLNRLGEANYTMMQVADGTGEV